MLLTMAGLMVAIVWLAAHAQERTLPPVSLPKSDTAALRPGGAPLRVTLRAVPGVAPEDTQNSVDVWIEDAPVRAGLAGLAAALRDHAAGEYAPGPQTPGRQTPGRQTPGRQTPGRQEGRQLTLRAGADVRWEAVLAAMSEAAKQNWTVSVAADR